MHLARFVDLAYGTLADALDRAALPADQRALLAAMIARHRSRLPGPQSDPLAPFFFVAYPLADLATPAALDLAAACLAFFFALRLADDVQDGETRHFAACRHRSANPAIVANDALVLFALASDGLHRAAAQLDPPMAPRIVDAHRRAWIASNRGQLADLTVPVTSLDPESTVALQRDKAATTRMFVEIAAVLAGRDQTEFGAIGESIAVVFQILNDVHDLFGKPESVDLRSLRASYPVVEFLHRADAAATTRFVQLVGALPGTLPDIRRLVYASGALTRTSARVDRIRRALDADLLAAERPTPGLRSLVQLLDRVCAAMYRREEPATEAALLCADGPWHREVGMLAAAFCGSVADLWPPAVVPWPQPVAWYDERQPSVFYPDLEGQPEEIEPVARAVLGPAATADDLRPVVILGLLHQLALATAHGPTSEASAMNVALRWARANRPALIAAVLDLAVRDASPGEPETARSVRATIELVAACSASRQRAAS